MIVKKLCYLIAVSYGIVHKLSARYS